jgi:Zn-dependent protease
MDLVQLLFVYIVIVLSAVVHEYCHAAMAKHLGDDTAEREGRLTLNPFAHLDMVGTVILPLLLLFTSGIFLGWAKPVPYNPYNLRDQKTGNLKVALAGPASNFAIAILLGLVVRFVPLEAVPLELVSFVVLVNIVLGVFNLIPVPPLDGSKVLYDLFPRVGSAVMRLGFLGIIVALLVAYIILPPITQALFRVVTGT